jgi:hypothetical protein
MDALMVVDVDMDGVDVDSMMKQRQLFLPVVQGNLSTKPLKAIDRLLQYLYWIEQKSRTRTIQLQIGNGRSVLKVIWISGLFAPRLFLLQLQWSGNNATR